MTIYNVVVRQSYPQDGGDTIILGSFMNEADAKAVCELYSEEKYGVNDSYIDVEETELFPDGFDPKGFAKYVPWTPEARECERQWQVRRDWEEFTVATRRDGAIVDNSYIRSGHTDVHSSDVSRNEAWFDANYPGGLKALREFCDDSNVRTKMIVSTVTSDTEYEVCANKCQVADVLHDFCKDHSMRIYAKNRIYLNGKPLSREDMYKTFQDLNGYFMPGKKNFLLLSPYPTLESSYIGG